MSQSVSPQTSRIGTLLCLCALWAAPETRADFAARFTEIKRTATPEQLYTFLYALPKGGDLHNHLLGAIRSEWWFAAATDSASNGGDTLYTRVRFSSGLDTGVPLIFYRTIRQKDFEKLDPLLQADYVRLDRLSVEQKQGWLDAMRLDRPREGREEFFSAIWPRTVGLQSNIAIVATVLLETMRAYGAEGLRYLETQNNPDGFVKNDGSPISADEAATFFGDRLASPEAVATGVTVRFQVVAIRFTPSAEKQLETLYAFADLHRDWWVAVNLAGIEENGHGYPSRFLDTFRRLRRTHPTLPLSIHAGEMDGPDHNIRDTLLLGASRIGHGVNLIKDPDTLLLLQNSQRVLVEINLISNRLLDYVPDLALHPFPEYLRTGVPVCLNTDDRGMWDSNLTDEYCTAVTLYNLSWGELVQLGRNSLTFSFVQPEVKARLLADYDKAVDEFEARYQSSDSLKALSSVKPVTYGYALRTWGFKFDAR